MHRARSVCGRPHAAEERQQPCPDHAAPHHGDGDERSPGSEKLGRGGNPADCTKLALEELLGFAPDWVISGINHGPNLGTDLLYSGTVAAAAEGTLFNIPSIAISSLDASLEQLGR